MASTSASMPSTEGVTAEALLQVVMRRFVGIAVNLYVRDCHRWSTRPCETCRTISDLVGEPFGCYWFATLPLLQQNREHGGN